MLVEPQNINATELGDFIKSNYGHNSSQPFFIDAGLDSWNYRMGDLWISLRRDLRGHYPEAYNAISDLPNSGVVNVIPPLKDSLGHAINSYKGYPIVVFPYVEHETLENGLQENDTAKILSLINALHCATVSNHLPSENFELSFLPDLNLISNYVYSSATNSGPLADTTHKLLNKGIDDIQKALARFEFLASFCKAESDQFVLTHGEPIPSNIIRLKTNKLYLIDLGDLQWAPPERDWSHIRRCFHTSPPQRLAYKELYDLKWILSEIAEYGTILMKHHGGSKDDYAMLQKLQYYLTQAKNMQRTF